MTESKTLSILHLAGSILSNPAQRCTGTLAETKDRKPVEPASPKACRWCLTGALSRAMNHHKVKVGATQERYAIYTAAKEAIGLDMKLSAPIYWDSNEHLHDEIVKRLVEAV